MVFLVLLCSHHPLKLFYCKRKIMTAPEQAAAEEHPNKNFSENGESSTDETVGSQGTSATRRNIRSVSAPRLRSCVILMFVVLAVVLPTIIYISARNAEVGNFESEEFASLSNQVVTSFESKIG
jgi:hypothetical protein